jgi:hypothetical protein
MICGGGGVLPIERAAPKLSFPWQQWLLHSRKGMQYPMGPKVIRHQAARFLDHICYSNRMLATKISAFLLH